MGQRLTYANVMSTFAVFVALGGGAYAAVALQKGDVTSKHVADNTLKSKDLKDGKAVKSQDVKDGSLRGADILDGSVSGADVASETLGSGNVLDESLTGADVENSTLESADIRNGSLTGIDIANGSLTSADIDHSSYIVSAYGDSISILGLSGTPTEIVSVPITIPVRSNIFASASFEIDSNGGMDDRVGCRLSRDSFGNFISREPQGDLPEGTFDRSWFALSGATTQDPGTYAIKLFCTEFSGETTALVANLIVWALPA